MMKIAVIGATGPTGIHLLTKLRKTVASVRVVHDLRLLPNTNLGHELDRSEIECFVAGRRHARWQIVLLAALVAEAVQLSTVTVHFPPRCANPQYDFICGDVTGGRLATSSARLRVRWGAVSRLRYTKGP
jgi:hypothetical protein